MAVLNSLLLIAGLLVLVLVPLHLFSIYIVRGLPDPIPGTVLSSESPVTWVFCALFYLSCCVFAPMVLAIVNEGTRMVDISYWATLVLLSLPAVAIIWAALKEYFTYRLTYDKRRIAVASYWRGSAQYRWADLSEVVVDAKHERYELYFSEASHIFLRKDQPGGDDLIAQIRQHNIGRDLIREF